MAGETTTKTTIILSTSSDWREWIEITKTAAEGLGVWDYMDPDTDTDHISTLHTPIEPQPVDINSQKFTITQLNETEQKQLRLLKKDYRDDLREYKERQKAIGQMRTRIQETVSRTNLHYTFDKTSVHDILYTLQQRFAPDDETREREMEQKYRSIKKSPKGIDVETWLQQWEGVYAECRRINLPDVEGDRAVRDFIFSAKSLAPGWSEYWANYRRSDPNNTPDIYGIIQKFREYRRDRPEDETRPIPQPAFATFKGNKGDTDLKECVCGIQHRYKDCWYLNTELRPSWWTPKKEKMEQITSILNSSPGLRVAVERAKNYVQKTRTSEGPNRPESTTPKSTGARDRTKNNKGDHHNEQKTTFAIDGMVGFGLEEGNDEGEYPLKNSFLLDSAAPIHVCNNYSRFKNFIPTTSTDSLRTGNSFARIEGYGTVEVNAIPATPGDNFCTLELINVAYVPTFHTNLVSFDRAWGRGIRWDTEQMTLNTGNNPLCKVLRKLRQWVLEYNPLSTHDKTAMATRRTTTPTSTQPAMAKGSVDLWHKRLAHLGKDMVNKLPNYCEGVQLVPTTEINPTCEVCRLTKAQRKISRRPTTPATEFMERVHFDLIQMTPGYNGDNWGLHFLEESTRMNYMYTYPSKADTVKTIKAFYAFVETQYNTKIRIFKRDGERTLGKAYKKWIRKKGIKEEISAPYTPEQNGAAERSGGVLITKARAMRIEAQLPEELWPEALQTAAYIANRSPNKALKGKTPYEKLNERLGKPNTKPNIAHIKVYGCKAYKRIPKLSKKRKMAARSTIGYLVGYQASNIFKIWFPKERKVLESRDVDFDENSKYNPTTPSLEEKLVETTPVQQVTVQIPAYKGDLTQFQPLEDEEEDEESEDPNQNTGNVEKTYEAPQLPTPEATPGPEQSEESLNQEQQEDRYPLKEICGDIDESNIVKGPRTRKPRREAYLVELTKPPASLSGYLSAFTTSLMKGKTNDISEKQIHREQLPPTPRSWKELMKHPQKDGFTAAADKEYHELQEKNTFKKDT
ncbi:hypothetical protein Egran_02301 [Elaphomyces granulatus]|uniref:Integrase catalytic domain-containing protein n=1 Tax=Elaphomyces granulatus TaxID=519963 RepID=A0A232M0Q1_9EURO|nr:hypothetical protein Egran_02301 [Elaphomyces granulatus]